MRLAHLEWNFGISPRFLESRAWTVGLKSLMREWDLKNKGHESSRAGGLRWECVLRRRCAQLIVLSEGTSVEVMQTVSGHGIREWKMEEFMWPSSGGQNLSYHIFSYPPASPEWVWDYMLSGSGGALEKLAEVFVERLEPKWPESLVTKGPVSGERLQYIQFLVCPSERTKSLKQGSTHRRLVHWPQPWTGRGEEGCKPFTASSSPLHNGDETSRGLETPRRQQIQLLICGFGRSKTKSSQKIACLPTCTTFEY